MVQVLLWPETLWEYVQFHLFKTVQSISCDEVRFGPGALECVSRETGSAVAVPYSRWIRIIWEGDYLEAVAKVRANFIEKMNGTAEPPSPESPAAMEGYR